MSEQRMIVADAVSDLEVIRRKERDALVTTRNRNRPNDLEILAGRVQALHGRFVDQINGRRSAAVHDRPLRRVQLDDDVVDAHADERRQKMLDRLDRDLIAGQAGGELNPGEIVDRRRHLVIAQIRAAKTDAEISRGGSQRKTDSIAGVETNSIAGDRATKCALYVHQPLNAYRASAGELSKESAWE